MRNLKKFLALVLAVMMVMGLMVTVNAAETPEVNLGDVNPAYESAADVLKLLGLVKGDAGTGDFRPTDTIKRSEFAAMVYRLYTGDVSDEYIDSLGDSASFTDLTPGAWYVPYVTFVETMGFMQGDTVGAGGTFRPRDEVTVYEAAKTLLCVLGHGQEGEYTGNLWKYWAGIDAGENGITTEITAQNVSLGSKATREIVAQMIFKTMFATTVTYDKSTGQYTDNAADKKLAADKFGVTPDTTGTDEFGNPVTAYKKDGVTLTTAATNKLVGTYGLADNKTIDNTLKSYDFSEATVIIDGDSTGLAATLTTAIQAGHGVNPTSGANSGAAPVAGTSVSVLTYLTGSDSRTVEVYASGTDVKTVIVKNTYVNRLAADKIKPATDAKAAHIVVDGVEYVYPAGEEYAAGDVLLYNKGVDSESHTVVKNVTKAKSFDKQLDRIVNRNGVDTYYMKDGTSYTASSASGNNMSSTEAAKTTGKDRTWYYLESAGKTYLVYFADNSADPTPTPTEETKLGYLLLLGNSEPIPGDWKAEDSFWAVEAYGILQDGSVFSERYVYNTAIINDETDQNELKGLYSYDLKDIDEDYLKITPVSNPNPTASETAISTGASSVTTAGGTYALTGETVFYFFEQASGKVTLKANPTPKNGNKEMGTINISSTDSKNLKVWVVAEDGVAKVVFVNAAFSAGTPNTNAPAEVTLVYVSAAAVADRTEIITGSAAKDKTYLYNAIGVGGETVEVTSTTELTAGVYKVDEEGKAVALTDEVKTADKITVVTDAVISALVSDTSISLNDAYLNCTADVVAFANDEITELAKGLKVVYVKGAATTNKEHDVIALWVVDEADTRELNGTVTVTGQTGAESNGYDLNSLYTFTGTTTIEEVTVGTGVKNVIEVTITGKVNADESAFKFQKNHVYAVTAGDGKAEITAVETIARLTKDETELKVKVTLSNVTSDETKYALSLKIQDVTTVLDAPTLESNFTGEDNAANSENLSGVTFTPTTTSKLIDGYETEVTIKLAATLTGLDNHVFKIEVKEVQKANGSANPDATVGTIENVVITPQMVSDGFFNVKVKVTANETIKLLLKVTDVSDLITVTAVSVTGVTATEPNKDLTGGNFSTDASSEKLSKGVKNTLEFTITDDGSGNLFVENHTYLVEKADGDTTGLTVTALKVVADSTGDTLDVKLEVTVPAEFATATVAELKLKVTDVTEFVTVEVTPAVTNSSEDDGLDGATVTAAIKATTSNKIIKGVDGSVQVTLTITGETASQKFTSAAEFTVSAAEVEGLTIDPVEHTGDDAKTANITVDIEFETDEDGELVFTGDTIELTLTIADKGEEE